MLFKIVLCICAVFFSISANNVQSLEHENVNGGLKAKLGAYPYHAYVEIRHGNTIIDCNGAIIGDSHVVTAAHCVTDVHGRPYDWMTVQVQAGTVFLKDDPVYRGFVKGIYIPIEFTRNHRITHADIAVLKLSESMIFEGSDYTIGYVELPERNRTFEGEDADFTGFGYNNVKYIPKPNGKYDIEGSSNGRLRHGETLILSRDDCLKSISSKKAFDFEDQLCARMVQRSADVYQGTCSGDSGGPLVVQDAKTNKKILVGVLSFSTPYCIEKVRASRYTRVSRYLNFIENAIKHTPLQGDDENSSYEDNNIV